MNDKVEIGGIIVIVFLFGYIAGNYVAYNQRADIEVGLLKVINNIFKECVIDIKVVNQTVVNSTVCVTVPYNVSQIPENFTI